MFTLRITTPLFLLLASVLLTPAETAARTVFAELQGIATNLKSSRFKVYVDLGFQQDWDTFGNNAIAGDDGDAIKFPSMVTALNYMTERGWKLAQSYPNPTVNMIQALKKLGWEVYPVRFLMVKEVGDDSQITDGLRFKHDEGDEGEAKEKKPDPATLTSVKIEFLTRGAKSKSWDVADEKDFRNIPKERLKTIIADWRSKTTEEDVFDVRVRNLDKKKKIPLEELDEEPGNAGE